MKRLFQLSFVTPGLRVAGLLVLALGGSIQVRAAMMATDNAGNYTSWSGAGAANNGSGFGNWTFSNSGSSGEFLSVGNSASGADGSQINNGGKSWGLFANSGGLASVTRTFTGGALAVGQQFLIKMDNGLIDNTRTVGFGLQNSSGANRFEFYFVGGTSTYTLNATGVGTQSGPGFTDDGLSLIFSQQTGNNFTLQVQVLGGSTFNYNGTIAASDISQIRFFNSNAGHNNDHNLYFNDIAVVPEPVTVALSIFGAVGGIGGLVRWRRKTKTETLKR